MPTAHSPTVTVVIPCYEGGSEVRATVDSVLAQTYADLEILIVDDGSRTDPVPDDLPEDPRIIIDRRPHNGGYARVTNHANARARGEWVTYVDADDTIEPTYVETMLRAGEAAQADLVHAPLMCVRDGKDIGPLPWAPPGPTSSAAEAIRRLVRNQLVGSQHVLLRKPTAPAPEDATFSDWVFLLRHLARSRTVAYVDAPLYRYTIASGSVTGGLRESVWELAEMPALARPIIDETQPPAEAAALYRELQLHTVTHMLHKASRERTPSALQDDITNWCRERITVRGIIELARHGHRTAAASWALAKISPRLHRRAYHVYDARKDRRA